MTAQKNQKVYSADPFLQTYPHNIQYMKVYIHI